MQKEISPVAAGRDHLMEWPRGDGEMARRIRAHDWAKTPLGPTANWSQRLKGAVETILSSGFPAFVWWGSDLIQFYNDAAIEIVPDRHPAILGERARQSWPNAWDEVGPLAERVLATGTPETREDRPLSLDRKGRLETAFFTLCFSALHDEVGDVEGIMIIAIETTARVNAEARRSFMLELSDALRALSDPVAVQAEAARILGERLGVSRVAYGEVAADGVHIAIVRNHVDAKTPAITGLLRMDDFGPNLVKAFSQGRTIAVPDVACARELTQAEREAYAELGIAAFVGVPLIKDGRLVASVSIHDMTRRDWTAHEIGLIEDTAARTWAAVELSRLRRRTEELNAFLVRFSDAVRLLADPQKVAETACRLVAEALGAERAYWAEVDWSSREYVIGGAFNAPDAPAITGRFPLDAWEPLTSSHLTGNHFAIDDTQTDPRIPPHVKESYARLAIGADLSTPVAVNGQLRCVIAINQRAPRHWSPDEIALVHGVAGRCWAEVERARAETRLRASEGRFRALADTAPVLIWEQRPDGAHFVNNRYLEFFGVGPEEIAGLGWARRLHPADRDRYLDIVYRAGVERQAFAADARFQRVDGTYRWLHNVGQPTGEGFIGASTDITDTVEAQAALRASEAQLRTLMQGIPQLVVRAGLDGDWRWSSAQWRAFTGQTLEESRGLGWLEALHADDRAGALQAWAGARSAGALDFESRIRRHDGAFIWHQTRLAPLRSENGEVQEWLGAATEIEELRQLQERQSVMVAELQHRTRNLIAVVRSIAQQTMALTGPGEAFREAFNRRLEALARVQGLLSRSDAEPITIRRIIRMELDALGALECVGKRILLEGPPVRLRHSIVQMLSLALHELATNARKHGALSTEKGRLKVSWRVSETDEGGRRLSLEWTETGGPAQVESASGQRGYGRELIELALPYALGAKTSFEQQAEGIRCTIDMPLEKKKRRRRD